MSRGSAHLFNKKVVSLLIVMICLLAGCSVFTNKDSNNNQESYSIFQHPRNQNDASGWWKEAVVYEIFVRSFMDSDGDGIGDIKGLISKLDYLNDGDPETTSDLGVNAIWLMPIFPATSYHGYDVTDYLGINPDYGTLDDFRALISESHERGIKVILDLPLNHSSVDHPWFQRSSAEDPDYLNYYIWSEEDPAYNGPMNETVWHPAKNGKYYYGIFNEGMPDLNYTNPKVYGEMERIIKFWVNDTGVDGFRLDAAQYLIEEGQRQDNTQSTHALYQRIRKFIKKMNPDTLLVGEIWNSSQQAGNYVQGDELDLAFDFDLAKAVVSAAGGRIAEQLNIVLDKDYSLFQDGTGMANFLTNHDMVRAMNSFSGDASKAKSAATILFTLPGTPFMYYGEEIGMTGEKPDPRIRTPMQWSSEELAGFTSNKPWEPINSDPGGMNVAAQINDPASLFSHYRTMIGIRRDHPALRDGDLHIVETGNRRVFAILRSNTQESVLVVVNLANEDIPNTTLSLKEGPLKGCYSTQSIFGDSTFANIEANRDGGFDEVIPNESLPANSNFIVRLVPCS